MSSNDWADYWERIYSAAAGPHADNATLFAETKRLIEAAQFPDPQRFAKRLFVRFIDRCKELKIRSPRFNICVFLMGAAAELYALEAFSFSLPNPADYSSGNYSAAIGMMRDMLLEQQRKAIHPSETLETLYSVICDSFIAITQLLPPIALEAPEGDPSIEECLSIPLLDVLPQIGTIIERALMPFSDVRADEIGLFRRFRQYYAGNLAKLETGSSRRAAPAPSDFDGTPTEIAHAYLDRTPFARVFFEGRIPVDIPLEDRGEHTAIVAGSGWGKTQLLQHMIAADLQDYDSPPGMVVINSTGAMVKRIQRLALFSNELKDRILIIDPELNPVPALNPFDLSSPRFAAYSDADRERAQGEIIDLFNYVFSTIKNPLTTRMETAFAFMVRLLLSIDGADIHTLLDLLDDAPPKAQGYDSAKFKPYIDKLDGTTQHFFRSQYYTGNSDGLREQIRARVFDILRVPAFERMFSNVNKLDFYDELNRGAIVLVNTSENLLKDGSVTFGRYIIARVMAAAFERAPISPDERRQAFLIVDEAAPYFDETFEKLLNRVRQYKLGVVIAFQNLEQASEKLRSTIASSTAIKYAGGTGYNDARWLAREMRVDPEFILRQKRDGDRPPKWTQFACYVRNFTDQAVSLNVPFYRLENMPEMRDAEHAALLERNRARVAAPPIPASPKTIPAPPPGAPPSDPSTAALVKAYAELSEAIAKSDWERASELKNGIIPELERKARPSQPRPTPASPDTPRPVATSRNEPPDEGTTEWR